MIRQPHAPLAYVISITLRIHGNPYIALLTAVSLIAASVFLNHSGSYVIDALLHKGYPEQDHKHATITLITYYSSVVYPQSKRAHDPIIRNAAHRAHSPTSFNLHYPIFNLETLHAENLLRHEAVSHFKERRIARCVEEITFGANKAQFHRMCREYGSGKNKQDTATSVDEQKGFILASPQGNTSFI